MYNLLSSYRKIALSAVIAIPILAQAEINLPSKNGGYVLQNSVASQSANRLKFHSLMEAVITKITGRITDQSGNSLPGVSVVIVETGNGTVTDADGNYALDLPNGNYTLKVSFIGYQSQTKSVSVSGENQSFDFTLKEESSALEEVVIIGSRSATARTNIDKPVPVDVIATKEVKLFGQQDISQMLTYAAPSFNSNRQTISDGTDAVDPASLRGLGPDQVLVLVNGKRRHTAALLNINGTVGRGSVGTDMNAIPMASIERLEVLRDGAAAQYGSDAIAGVINLVLKKNTPWNISATYGQSASHTLGKTYTDGANTQLDISKGFGIGKKGFVNISGQYLGRGYTNRVGTETRPLIYSTLPSKGANETEADFQTRYAALQAADQQKIAAGGFDRSNEMRVGNSDSKNFGLALNSEYAITPKTSAYLFSTYAYRTSRAGGFYRLPSQATQSDLTIFPNGFLPFIKATLNDFSIGGGIHGEIGTWNYDLSNTYGQNSLRFDIENTINASLPQGTSPTKFYAGKLTFNQNTTNLDVSRKLKFDGALSSLNIAFGAEHRIDTYSIAAGEELSYSYGQPSKGIAGAVAGTSPKAAGAQVFPGYRPDNALTKSRNNTGIYADFEAEFGPKLLVEVAGRNENYSDFGNNFSYKTTARYKFFKDFALRGAVSTGFRAPSLQQHYFNNISTQFVSGQPTQVLTVNNDNSIVRQFGIGSLKAEISQSYSLGIAGKIFDNLTFTIDAYQIDIKGRIVFSSSYARERNSDNSLNQSGFVNTILNTVDPTAQVNSVQFFTNAINTQTKGLDVVLSDKFLIGQGGKLTLTAAANFNKTKVTNVDGGDKLNSNPAQLAKLFNRTEYSRYESSIPKSKINLTANYAINKWSFLARAVRFGAVTYLNSTDPIANNLSPLLDQTFSPKWITDLAATYKITKSLSFTLGANNLFDVYPDRNNVDPRNRADNLSGDSATNYSGTSRDNSNYGLFPYNRAVMQFGFNGRFVYGKLAFTL